MTSPTEIIESFRCALQDAGLPPPAEIIPDSKDIIRFDVKGDRPGSKNGFYKLHLDNPPSGVFGSWKLGIRESWTLKGLTAMTPEERATIQRRIEADRRQREEAEAKQRAECRKEAARRLETAQPAPPGHPYLARKRVKPHGLKIDADGRLLVPVGEIEGMLHGLQRIDAEGEKRFTTGTRVTGCSYLIGCIQDGPLVVCEGFATGATIHEVTGYTVAAAFNAGNLRPVAEAIRGKYPACQIIIAADHDRWTEGNPGLTKGEEAAKAVNGLLAVPEFSDLDGKPTDFNDQERLDGPDAVRRSFKKAMEQEEVAISDTPSVAFRRLSEITARPVRWLWPGRIALGKINCIAGDPGLGKSQLSAALTVPVTTAGRYPGEHARCEQGNVVILSAEDEPEDTIRPRLEAAGADLSRVFVVDAVTIGDGKQRSFNLGKDVARLGALLNHIGNVKLVIIDPITAYLGGEDSRQMADMRALLSPLSEIAARYGAAIVYISHLNKGGGQGAALMRVTGSLAFVAAARAAYIVTKDKENPHRRLFLPIKNNLGDDITGLAFSIESHTLKSGIETSRIMWEGGKITVSADEAVMTADVADERSAMESAKEFLIAILTEGPVASKLVKIDADGAGHQWRTVRRAQEALGIKPRKEKTTGQWVWSLPSSCPQVVHVVRTNTSDNMDNLTTLEGHTSETPDLFCGEFDSYLSATAES